MVVQIGGGRTLNPREFNKAFDGALKLAKDCECEVEDFRKDIVKVACLLIEEGLDLTTFLHKSILDYHAAAFVKELTDARAQTFYLAAAKDFKKWQHALNFLKIIDQTRYAKDYFLLIAEIPHNNLRNALHDENEKAFYQYLIKLNPGISAGFHHRVLVSWGNQRANRNEIDQEIDSEILRSVVDLYSELSESEMDDIHQKRTGGNKSTVAYEISFPDTIKIGGIEIFRRRLSKYETTLFATIEEYKAVVAREVSQENIFEDLFGPAKKATRKKRTA
jgi:hypothetical protein